jgi:glutamyl-tRNA synthetase
MPLVLGETGNKKLSKRDPQADLFLHRERGFIHEGLLNYLALLGWSIAADRDVFSLDEFVAAFDIVDVNPNPARFDQKKAESINGDHIRMLDAEDFADRLVPYLHAAGLIENPRRRPSRRHWMPPHLSCRSVCSCSARLRGCWASCSVTTSPTRTMR